MIIVASNGYEVIDNRPEAENADSLAKHFENRYAREQKCKLAKQLHKNKHPFAQKLLSVNRQGEVVDINKKGMLLRNFRKQKI